jgi:hypothetical protein
MDLMKATINIVRKNALNIVKTIGTIVIEGRNVKYAKYGHTTHAAIV